MMKEDMQGKKTVAQNGMTIGKGNSTSESVKVIP